MSAFPGPRSVPLARRRPVLFRLAWQSPLAAALLAATALCGGSPRPELAGAAFVALATAELCRVDAAERRLPNSIVLPGTGCAVFGVTWQSLIDGSFPVVSLVSGLGFFLFLLVLNRGGGMGAGDVKLALLLGVAIGPFGAGPAVAGPVIAFVSGGIAGVGALFARRPSTTAGMPFGPFLLFGFWIAIGMQSLTE